MRLLNVIAGLVALCALTPAAANAADVWELSFGGPQAAEFVIRDLDGTPYVSGFWASGTSSYGRVHGAVPANWTSTLPNIPANENANRLLSTVTLTDTGGTIKIGPSFMYEAFNDGYFELTLNYTLSSPEPVGALFTDPAITGSYSYSYYVNSSIISGYPDFTGAGGGTFTSLTAYIPEPGTWAMLIAGLFGCGAALRIRRARRIEGSAAA